MESACLQRTRSSWSNILRSFEAARDRVQKRLTRKRIENFNASVLEYNQAIATFPSVILAGPLGFTKRDFFEAEPEAAEVPVVALR